MNKFKIRPIFIGLFVLTLCTYAWADNASRLDYHNNVPTAVAIGDGSSGDLVEVDSCGAMKVYLNQIHGANGTSIINADTQLKASQGTVYAIMVTTDGVTSGDTLHIENDADGGDGCPLISFTFGETDQVYMFMPSMGVNFSEGIYFEFDISGGTCDTTTVWR